jgi:ferrous iron transport protein A
VTPYNEGVRYDDKEYNVMIKSSLKKPKAKALVKLSFLMKGQKGIVVSLDSDNLMLRRRLLDMGITEGVMVVVKKIAPLGDPVDILIRGYELCLRKKDMEVITVEVVS